MGQKRSRVASLLPSGSGLADVGQLAFEMDQVSLRDTTFVVVDLETTGGRATESAPGRGDHDQITEIGAVKVRGGVVLGELATFVDPGRSIPPQIVALTGITTAMVCDAPRIESVLPPFLEFSRGAVLVAHNSGFDIGFLKAAAKRCHIAWPQLPVLCTVKLARRVLTRDEAPSVRLSALAQLFGATTTPNHRALDDARATVDVLHALIERVGNQGVHSYHDLRSYLPDVTPTQRRKRHLAAKVPNRPGVYLFRGPAEEVLYVGTAVDLRRRVSQYFNGADPRTRMKEMVALATRVDHVECAHDLEAGVRELRLLAAHAPPYNRRSKFPHKWWWVVLTDEPFPRFSVVRAPRHDRAIGPFRVRADAHQTAVLLARFTGVRTCTTRLGRSALHGPACPERELSPCPAPRGAAGPDYAEGPRRGQLSAAGNARHGVPPMPVVDAICAAAQAILPAAAPLGGALVEETGLIARWLAQPGVRIVRSEPGYATPLGAAGRLAEWAALARSARLATEQTIGDEYDVRYGPRAAGAADWTTRSIGHSA
jgi:DNA polymerase-3 subunit epsilon